MTIDNNFMGRAWARWRTVWPCCVVVIFAGLALTHSLPAGFERAIIAAPIVLSAPGALTLGALVGRSRLDGVAFSCYAILLSVLWSVFASIILYSLHVLISAKSMYWCLLLICVLFAAVAQFRLLSGSSELFNLSERQAISAMDADQPRGFRAAGYAVAAFSGGVVLLGGATYSYLHSARPAPVGYTWIAWTGPQVEGVIPVGPSGARLPFQIEHHEMTSDGFRLTATWTGTGSSYSLARPVIVRLGPDKTMYGELAIPAPPGGCTYRVEVTLTELGEAHPQSWFINADVGRRAQQPKTCGL